MLQIFNLPFYYSLRVKLNKTTVVKKPKESKTSQKIRIYLRVTEARVEWQRQLRHEMTKKRTEIALNSIKITQELNIANDNNRISMTVVSAGTTTILLANALGDFPPAEGPYEGFPFPGAIKKLVRWLDCNRTF